MGEERAALLARNGHSRSRLRAPRPGEWSNVARGSMPSNGSAPVVGRRFAAEPSCERDDDRTERDGTLSSTTPPVGVATVAPAYTLARRGPNVGSLMLGGESSDVSACERDLADREGFEPSRSVNPYTLSRRAPSTARPPIRFDGTRLDAAVRRHKARTTPLRTACNALRLDGAVFVPGGPGAAGF